MPRNRASRQRPESHTFVEIDAASDTVWQLISDPTKIAQWNLLAKKVVGLIAPGQAITLHGDSGAWHATVSEVLPGKKIVWGGKSAMSGTGFTRKHTLEVIAPGRLRYANREELSGLGKPVVRSAFGSGHTSGPLSGTAF